MDPNTRDSEAGLPANGQAQRSRTSVPSLLFIVAFILYMLTSHNGDEFLARHQYQNALQSLTYHLSNYSAWMNGTASNFSMPEGDAAILPLLDTFHILGRPSDPSVESYYSNITGYIHGDVAFTNISAPALRLNHTLAWKQHAQQLVKDVNFTGIESQLGSWNWSTSTKISFSVVEKRPLDSSITPVTFIRGRMELSDFSDSSELKLEFEGVHFVSNGTIFGLAESLGHHIDIRLLPSLVPDDVRNQTAHMIEPELQDRIEKLKNLIDDGVVDSEAAGNDETPKTSCPFTFYARINPVTVPEYLLQELEEEMQNPTGIPTVSPPRLSIDGLLVSKSCGILFEISNTEGLRSVTFFRKVTTYAGLTAFGYLVMIWLFIRQAKSSRTASGILRVSRWTFLAQTTMDSVSFAGHITFAILAEGRTSLTLVAPAFLACVMFICQAQFSALIHQIQGPENYTPPPATRPLTGNVSSGPSPSLLPMTSGLTTAEVAPVAQQPTTSPQAINNSPPTSFFAFFVHHIRTDPQARMWLLLIIFLIFVVRVILSPLLSLLFVAIAYCSIWLPQIVRSIRRGRSSGLSKKYILGNTTFRLFSVLYFLGCPRNVLEVEPRSWIWLLAAFVYLQAFVVILQGVFGPTFFLPQRFAESKSYNYHPPMAHPRNPEQSLGDCAICMDPIIVEPGLRRRSSSFDSKELPEQGVSGSPLFRNIASILRHVMQWFSASSTRKNYSLAPCCHLFHTECLEKWLVIKYICPHCRRPLPPL